MTDNRAIAATLERVAALLELTGANRFKVAAYQRAARAIEALPAGIAGMVERGEDLTEIDGIGAGIAGKVAELVQRDTFDELDELQRTVPVGLVDVLEVPGLGPKTVKTLWETKGVESIADLKRAIDAGELDDVPRLGKKSIENIRTAIAFRETAGERVPLGRAMPIAEELVERLRALPGVQRAAYAGSLRRGRDTIGDLDFLVSADDTDAVREAFASMPEVEKVLASGPTKTSVRLRRDKVAIQADLRLVDDAAFGAALMYFTGSKEHNVRLRERALKQGMTLNEYGVFDDDDPDAGPPQQRGIAPVAAATEEEVYAALGLPYIEPERREDRGELAGDQPKLIELADIKAELHAHTTASDGRLSIEELATLARERGFHTIAVTDHSKSSAIAGGLDEDRLRAHIEAVRKAGKAMKGVSVLAGSEVDILADGRLDYDDDLLAALDVVVASPHAALNQDDAAATKRLLRAIEHPLVHVLGHPTGRLIGRREGLHPAMDEIYAAAAEHAVALEINANWRRLDLRDVHVAAAVDAGCVIAIDCDVHRPEDYDHLRYGVLTARRGGLTAKSCVNAWSKKKLHDWLGAKRN